MSPSSPAYKIRMVILLLCGVFLLGTLGFTLIEGWGFLDSFFMTLITITTIGYREIRPLSDAGKLFDIVVIFLGVGTYAYGFATIVQSVVEGEVQRLVGRRRLDKKITSMKQHYIICGNGRIGSLISEQLLEAGKPFVIIDCDPDVGLKLETGGLPHIIGDATDEELLRKAGLDQAKGLIATASSDVTNVYITLIAREMNPAVYIMARAESEDSVKNLKRAGADRVISPYQVGGRHMANLLLKPTVVDFVELATGEQRDDFIIQMEGFRIRPGSDLMGSTLKDAPIRKDLGLIVVAIKPEDGTMVFNPPAEQHLAKDDVLVCIGDPDALKAMDRLVRGTR